MSDKKQPEGSQIDANTLIKDLMTLQTKKNRSQGDEEAFQQMLIQIAEENPALVAEIIQKWLKE